MDLSEPIVFMSVVVNVSGRLCDDFLILFYLHDHRETSVLTGELTEETDQFRFLRAGCLVNLKVSVGLINQILGHEDFSSTYLHVSSYLFSSLHSLSSPPPSSSSFPSLISSTFYLSGT